MTNADADPQRPSGTAWPPALRHALGIPESKVSTRNNDDDTVFSSNSTVRMTTTPHFTGSFQSDTSFTTSQLRQYIHRGYAALSSLQRQLHRGEESYFEESYAHGNLFSGWDNIWIEAGVPTSSSGENNSGSSAAADGHAVAAGAQKSAPSRKMPNDHRWFSSSCHVAPRGDAKVATILLRESLLEPPPSSGAVLNEVAPLKVAQMDIGMGSPTTKRVDSTKTEPTNKKVKLDGGILEPNSVTAREILSSNQQIDQIKPSRSLAPLSSENLEMAGAIKSEVSSGSVDLADGVINEVMSASSVSSSAVVATSLQQAEVILSSSNEIHAPPESKSTNQSTAAAREEIINSTCDMEVGGIVQANADASGELYSTTKSANHSLSPSTEIASLTKKQTNFSCDTINTVKCEMETKHSPHSSPETSTEKSLSSTKALQSLESVQEPSTALSNEPSFEVPDHEASIAASNHTPSPRGVDESKGDVSSPDNIASLSEREELKGDVPPAMGNECEMTLPKQESQQPDSAACLDVEKSSSDIELNVPRNVLSVENTSQPCNLQQDPEPLAEVMESPARSVKPVEEKINETMPSEQPGTAPVEKIPTSSEKAPNDNNFRKSKKQKTSATKSPLNPETPIKSRARNTDIKKDGDTTAHSDSDEDQTLSQIVQLKAKSTSKEDASPIKASTSETKSHASKRTSSRKRRNPH